MAEIADRLHLSQPKIHLHPLSGESIQIADAENVWPPYSAFHLAKHCLPIADQIARRNGHQPKALDIGTGSGIIPIMAKQTIPNLAVIATDLNPNAAELATYNWDLNGLPPGDLTTTVADSIDDQVVQLCQAQGKVDLLFANLPQQPLVNGDDLAALREHHAAAWNCDATRDLDGLGIFIGVLSRAHEVVIEGGAALVSASSKQNEPRIVRFLNQLVADKKAKSWCYVSTQRFDIPQSYLENPHLMDHWLAMEKKDNVQRIYYGDRNQPQYDHYNIQINF
jgi:methylase of polypeptide subunit release factors